MASVAKCPQCEHDLLIPDGADLAAWAKCPACSAFFQLEEVTLRDVVKPILVDSDFAPIKSHDEDDADAGVDSYADEHEHAESDWRSQSSSSSKTLADFASPMEDEIAASADEPAGADAQDEAEFHRADVWFKHKQVKPRMADIKGVGAPLETPQELAAKMKPVQEPTTGEPVLKESAEAASARIDKWFRSANTVTDLPPVVPEERADAGLRPLPGEIGHAPELEPLPELDAHASEKDASTSDTHSPDEWGSTDLEETPINPTARTLADFAPQQPAERAGATVEFSADALAAADDDFELDGPSATPQKTRPWDDSEHMERLLADADPDALEPFEPVIHQSVMPAEPPAGEDDAASWMMKHPPRAPRKRSVVRTMATTVVGGLFGLGIGYFAWLWAIGPRGDFMEVAKYIPSAMLPASFQHVPIQITHDTTAAPPAEADPASETKAEVQARFETEANTPDTTTAVSDDRYATAPAAASSEPPKFEEPPVVSPLGETASVPALQAVAGAPSYNVDELAVALRAAQEAQPGLVAGDLGESKAVQQTKGKSYAALCELAEKLTFVDASARADYATALTHDAERLYRETLSDAHTRGEVARIAPIWTSSANRHIGGIFFAGNLTTQPGQEIVEGQVDLGGGTSIPVLLSKELAAHLEGAGKPMGVVGSIIVDPAKRVTGYTGGAKQAVWVHSLIPLE